jgi:cation transport regulator ChaC
MEDFLNKVEYVRDALNEGGYPELAKQILDVQLSGGTPGEVFAGIAYYLNKMKDEHSQAYLLAREQIDEIIQYARSINYLP